MTGTVKKGVSPMNRMLAILFAGALLLSASGAVLAGGGWGSVGGGSDGFGVSDLEEDQHCAAEADEDRPGRLGGKAGVDPGKSDASGAV
jgi:hypothetical protein